MVARHATRYVFLLSYFHYILVEIFYILFYFFLHLFLLLSFSLY